MHFICICFVDNISLSCLCLLFCSGNTLDRAYRKRKRDQSGTKKLCDLVNNQAGSVAGTSNNVTYFGGGPTSVSIISSAPSITSSSSASGSATVEDARLPDGSCVELLSPLPGHDQTVIGNGQIANNFLSQLPIRLGQKSSLAVSCYYFDFVISAFN